MSERDFFTIVSRLSDPADPQPVPMAVVPAAGAGKFDELPQYFTEDSELRIHGFAPIEEFWQGCANMVEAVRANFARISHQNSSIEGLIQQGRRRAAGSRDRRVGRRPGTHERALTNGPLRRRMAGCGSPFRTTVSRASRSSCTRSFTKRAPLHYDHFMWHQLVEFGAVKWWVPVGHEPTSAEGDARLAHLQQFGLSEAAFSGSNTYPAPAAPRMREGIVPEWSYDGRVFGLVENSDHGDNRPGVTFLYRQVGNRVWATYGGGEVKFGALVARVEPDGQLDMRYQHWGPGGTRTGQCRSTPEWLPDGRLRLVEEWQWTNGDRTAGRGVIEEIA